MISNRNNDNQWISIHLFYKNDLNMLLLMLIDPVLKDWYTKDLITNHFFIRYWERGQHVRLRIKPTNMLSKEVIIKNLIETYKHNFFGSKNYDEDFKFTFIDYIQELNRYGGPYSIRLAESAFEQSSITIMDVLKKHRQHWDNSMAVSIALQAHLLFVKASGEKLESIVQYLGFLSDNHIIHAIKKERSQSFRKEVNRSKELFEMSYIHQKKSIDYLCKAIWEQDRWEASDWRLQWSKSAEKMVKEFSLIEYEGLLEEPQWLRELIAPQIPKKTLLRWAIWSSYFHMTNNRIGIYLRDESFIYYSLKKGILALSN